MEKQRNEKRRKKRKEEEGKRRASRKRSRYLAHLAAVARAATTAVGAGKAPGNSRKAAARVREAATTQLI